MHNIVIKNLKLYKNIDIKYSKAYHKNNYNITVKLSYNFKKLK
jgi:hypothetical protein